MKYSVIIGVAVENESRYKRVNECVDSWHRTYNDDYELIVVEQILSKRHLHYTEDVINIQIEDKQRRGVFKGWMWNVGAKIAKGDYLIFCDADMFVPKGYIDECDRIDTMFAFGAEKYIYSTKEETERLYQDYNAFYDIQSTTKSMIAGGELESNFNGIGLGFINMFRRDFFDADFVGFNENYSTCLYDDTDAVCRVGRLLGFHPNDLPHVPSVALHQYHDDTRTQAGSIESMKKFYEFLKEDPVDIGKKLRAAKIGDPSEPKFI